jgi:hypothetical protein
MTDYKEKYEHLLKVLKLYAESKHCYETEGDDFSPSSVGNYDDAFEVGAEFGEIAFARTLLEQIGVEFEYPVMKEND